MNSASEHIIFQLADREGVDYLTISLSNVSKNDNMEINLNDSVNCQNEFRLLFAKLIEIIIEKDISVTFEKNADYPRALIQSAMEAYVEDLKTEIRDTRQQIMREIAEQE